MGWRQGDRHESLVDPPCMEQIMVCGVLVLRVPRTSKEQEEGCDALSAAPGHAQVL